MPIICHRVNTIKELESIPDDCGVELDVRFDTATGRLYLCHDNSGPESINNCDYLDDYLKSFKFNPQRIVIFNIKDSGSVSPLGKGRDVEWECIRLAAENGIPKSNYFLLDVEFPFIYFATKAGVREIAVRFSEAEPKEQFLYFKNNDLEQKVDWVLIDVNSELPLNVEVVNDLKGFRTCLVCPERWGRPDDIEAYAKKIADLGMKLDAVMTKAKNVERWKATGVVLNTRSTC